MLNGLVDTVTRPASWTPLALPEAHRSIRDRLRDVAAMLPDDVALASPGRSLTFAELDRAVDRIGAVLAAGIGDGGAGDPPPLLVTVEQDAGGVLTVLAAIALGRPIVLVDPFLPAERVRWIAATTGARHCVTDAVHRRVRRWFRDMDVTVLEVAVPAGEAVGPLPTAPAIDVDTPLSIAFTSGSTGTPKGVAHSHGHFLNEAYGAAQALGLGPGDRALMALPIAFGAGSSVIYMALLNGAGLFVLDPRVTGARRLADWITEQQLTTAHLTPSLLRSLVEALDPGETLDCLRLVTTCGEPVHADDVAAVRRHTSATCVYANWAGSSETGHLGFNVFPAQRAVPSGLIAVGLPAANRTVRVVGDDGAPVAAGTTGHVEVVSRHLAWGYWNQPELTATRFVPTGDAPGERVVRTGDLGRFDPATGELELRGRADAAIKLRGYLVEPSEIESVLLAMPNVGDAVVTVRRAAGAAETASRDHLVAHVSQRSTAQLLTVAAVRRHMREHLPQWMVPSDVVILTEMPRTERGKIDRAALPSAPPRPRSAPPRTSVERQVAAVWRDILNLDDVGVDDDFFEVGGDSLAAIEMIVRLNERFSGDLSTADLAAMTTVGEIAGRITRAVSLGDRASSEMVVVRRGSSARTVFGFAGAGSSTLGLVPLARRIGGDDTFCAFQARGLESRALADWSVDRAARRHVADGVRVRPTGPYVMVGYSYGGLLALRSAQLLAAQGHEVPLLVIIDCYLPGTTPVMSPTPAAVGGDEHHRRSALRRGLRAMFPDGLRSWTFLPMALRVLGAGALQPPPRVQRDVFYFHSRMVTQMHRARPWSGRSVLVLANGNHANRRAWDDVLVGPCRVVEVPADHTALIDGPWMAQVANIVAEELAVTGDGRRAGDG